MILNNSFYSDIASAGMRSNWCCAKGKSSFFLIQFVPTPSSRGQPLYLQSKLPLLAYFDSCLEGHQLKLILKMYNLFNGTIDDTRILGHWLTGSRILLMWSWRLRIPSHLTNSPDSQDSPGSFNPLDSHDLPDYSWFSQFACFTWFTGFQFHKFHQSKCVQMSLGEKWTHAGNTTSNGKKNYSIQQLDKISWAKWMDECGKCLIQALLAMFLFLFLDL